MAEEEIASVSMTFSEAKRPLEAHGFQRPLGGKSKDSRHLAISPLPGGIPPVNLGHLAQVSSSLHFPLDQIMLSSPVILIS